MAIIHEQPAVVEPRTGGRSVIKVEPPQQVYEEKKAILRYRQIIWYVLGIIELLLLIRFLLKLFGANPTSLFAILTYTISTPFTIIFIDLFPSTVSGAIIIEWSTLFAMLIYLIIAWEAIRLYKFKKPIDPEEAEIKVS